MDHYDQSILRILQEDGRTSNLHLSERIHLSPPQTLRRVRALEEKGVIRSYVAQINPESVGLGVMAFSWLVVMYRFTKLATGMRPENLGS